MKSPTRVPSQSIVLTLVALTALTLASPALPGGEVVVTAEVAKLLALDGQVLDDFGETVSLDGDRLAVGVRWDDDNGLSSGSAYIFERNADGSWSQITKILPLDGQEGDRFGRSLSLDGDRLAVGASGSNSAYIFEQNADGSWSQVTKILSLDGRPGDRFGGSLSLDGDRVAVGAYGDDFNGSSSGSAYIFERDAGGSWSQVAKILPLDGRPGDDFGEAVSLDGDRLAVGAAGNDDNGSGSGSAYIFERNADGSWSPVTKILPLDGQAGDDFGEAVSLDDDRLAVGAQDDDDNGSDSGSAYIFERNEDGNWPPVTKILPLDGQASDAFGDSVSLDGDRLAVGAFFGNADNGLDSGSAYIFERNPDGSWSQVSEIFPLDGQVSDFFGDSVSLDGDRLAVGASGDADNGPDTGSAYIFDSVLVSPQLSIAGTCPGEITLISGGNTPRSGVSLYHSANVGTFSLGVGACDGTEIELDAPDLLRSDAVGFDPGFTRVRAVDEFWCGRFLQLIDERTCLTSEVVQVP